MSNDILRDAEPTPRVPESESSAGDELREYAEAARRQAWQDPLQHGR